MNYFRFATNISALVTKMQAPNFFKVGPSFVYFLPQQKLCDYKVTNNPKELILI